MQRRDKNFQLQAFTRKLYVCVYVQYVALCWHMQRAIEVPKILLSNILCEKLLLGIC